jgi:hypothetical protein
MKILPKKTFKRRSEVERCENPYVKLELVNGSNIDITSEWPPGTDLSAFSQMLALLHRGELLRDISASMNHYASQIGESDKSIGAHLSMMGSLGKEKKPNGPVVSPRKAIRYNMRLHHG